MIGFSPRSVTLVREEPGGVAGRRSYGKCRFILFDGFETIRAERAVTICRNEKHVRDDGSWHHLLAYRIMDRGEHAGGDPPPQSGQYVEEISVPLIIRENSLDPRAVGWLIRCVVHFKDSFFVSPR